VIEWCGVVLSITVIGCCVVVLCLRVCVFACLFAVCRCSLFVVRWRVRALCAVCCVLCAFAGVIIYFFVCSAAFVRSVVGLFACFLSRLVVCFPAELPTYSL